MVESTVRGVQKRRVGPGTAGAAGVAQRAVGSATERNLGLLSAFHARKGHADEPFRNDEERVNLMKWFMRKCQDFNHSGKPRFGHSASGKYTR
jgi:hypothetical protein